RRNIGLWYWEQEYFPPKWHSAFDYYDEVWVPSEFTRKALAAVSPVPLEKITYPFYIDAPEAKPARSGFGLREDSFVFLFNFDFLSTIQRKNPLGLIQAFRKAFKLSNDVVLVLKSINGDHDPDGKKLLKQESHGLNIHWIESHLPAAQM